MAKGNKNVGSADVVKNHVQGGVLTQSPPARPVAPCGVSKNVPAGVPSSKMPK